MKSATERSVGVVPFCKDGGQWRVCLVRHADGHWAFPKGHQDEGESDEQTALRELREETGIAHMELLPGVLLSEHYSFERDGVRYGKEVRYFMGVAASMAGETEAAFRQEITAVRWLSLEEAKGLITFPEGKKLLEEAAILLSI